MVGLPDRQRIFNDIFSRLYTMHQRGGSDRQADGQTPADSWYLATDQISMKFYRMVGYNPGTNRAQGHQSHRTIILLNMMFGKLHLVNCLKPQLARRPKVPAEHVWSSCLCHSCASNLELTVGWTAKPGSPQCHLPTQLKDVSVSTIPGALGVLEALCDYALYKSTFTLHCITLTVGISAADRYRSSRSESTKSYCASQKDHQFVQKLGWTLRTRFKINCLTDFWIPNERHPKIASDR